MSRTVIKISKSDLEKVFFHHGQISHTNEAHLTELQLCSMSEFFETKISTRTYNGIRYKFRVVALTEYSAMSTGKSTRHIGMIRLGGPSLVNF